MPPRTIEEVHEPGTRQTKQQKSRLHTVEDRVTAHVIPSDSSCKCYDKFELSSRTNR